MLIAHLDFKGVLPRPAHLPQLLQDIASLGIDGILVEYEDIFPFDGIDVAYEPREVWSKRTLKKFLDEAARLGLEVIPLQQCLGHLEYVFRWGRYRDYALDVNFVGTADITRDEVKRLLFDMLGQVIEAHPDSRFIHLGMDEAHAIVVYAAKQGLDVVDLFLDHLDELCTFCEARGVTPIIWSDMLEDHFNRVALERFDSFKDRVILCSWDYDSTGSHTDTVRIAGSRISQQWLSEPENPAAPPVSPGTKWLEDLGEEPREALAPFREGRGARSLYWCDIWTQRGFRVLGASASRENSDEYVLPDFNRREANIRCWNEAITRTGAMGHVLTSWARGTTFGPPFYQFDMTWPILENAARTAGKNPTPFFEGIDSATVRRLIATLGRCKTDWRLEDQIADEMFALAPQLVVHRHEWESIALMARALAWQRRAAYARSEVDYFFPGTRPLEETWGYFLSEQKKIIAEGQALRRTVKSHFGARYYGDAFEEWLGAVFSVPINSLQQCEEVCRERFVSARARYHPPKKRQ